MTEERSAIYPPRQRWMPSSIFQQQSSSLNYRTSLRCGTTSKIYIFDQSNAIENMKYLLRGDKLFTWYKTVEKEFEETLQHFIIRWFLAKGIKLTLMQEKIEGQLLQHFILWQWKSLKQTTWTFITI